MIPFVIWNRQNQSGPAGVEQHDDAAAQVAPQPQSVPLADALVETIPDPFVLVDAGGRVVAANAAARHLFAARMTGEHLSQQIRAPSILDTIGDVIETGVARTVSFERRTGGGRRFEATISSIASGLPDETAPAAAILLRDMTDRQHLDRMRADFVANASHELRTPLASITGYIETLQGPARTDQAAQDRFLGRMLEQAHRMRRLIDDLLSLSRVEMNVHRTPSSVVDLSEIARYACEMMTSASKAEDCKIRVDAPAAAPVTGDRDELLQVVQNLIENAIKYGRSDKGIDVIVRIDAARRKVSLSVRDYGRGIAEEHLPRLTERFYRVSEQESRSRGGTGLGLAIVKHILLRHGADLDIESRIGQGTTFTIAMPVAGELSAAAE
jgi:two-component system phosphate regulon sensor histidine kinase PhoR